MLKTPFLIDKAILEIPFFNQATAPLQVRTVHVAALASRTELEGFLRQCVADVKRQISVHRLEAMESVGTGQQSEMVREERDRLLELLLSQERVISLLQERYNSSCSHKLALLSSPCVVQLLYVHSSHG